MNKKLYTGKTVEEAIEKALIDLQEIKENIFYKSSEVKGGLFKAKSYEIEVVTKSDVIAFIKDFLQQLTHNMGIGINLEVKNRDKNVVFTIFSDNNSILIGKNGRTLDALTVVTRQVVTNQLGTHFNFIIDIGEYKERQQHNLERTAIRIAKEVAKTKIDAKLDPMNAYERRLVHNAVGKIKKVYTESVGEEPNRCVVIKYKEED